MQIIFDPSINPNNHYITMIVRGLKEKGFSIKSYGDALRNPSFFIRTKYVHLNWFEGIQGSNIYKIFTLFLKQLGKLILLVAFNKKIIWTMHNKVSHDSKASFYSSVLTWLLIKLSYKIVIHSHISKNILINNYNVSGKKIVYIPHPNYINFYDFNKKVDMQKRDQNKLKILFFGAVKPYKNIELLIKVAKDLKNLEIDFSIIGNPYNKIYADSLINQIKGFGNIKLDLSFIEDSKLINEIRDNDLVVLPYSKFSSLNSGSVILAFSLKKTVICPKIGTILDVEPYINVFSYDYVTEEDHYINLKNQLKTVYSKWLNDKNVISNFGLEAYKYVDNNNDIKEVVKKYSLLYRSKVL